LDFLSRFRLPFGGYLYARRLGKTEPEITRVEEKKVETRDENIETYENAVEKTPKA
jgi:hypothetical protein